MESCNRNFMFCLWDFWRIKKGVLKIKSFSAGRRYSSDTTRYFFNKSNKNWCVLLLTFEDKIHLTETFMMPENLLLLINFLLITNLYKNLKYLISHVPNLSFQIILTNKKKSSKLRFRIFLSNNYLLYIHTYYFNFGVCVNWKSNKTIVNSIQ